MNLSLYSEVKSWKVPLHKSKTALAKTYLKLLSNTEVIGVAGSVGKTLTQNVIFSVLSQKYPAVVGEENLDPTFRIPKTILKAKPWHKYLILEYGIEHPGEMDYYTELAAPKYAVMTTISEEHTKYFRDLEGVFEEESKFITNLPKTAYAVLNADDKKSQHLSKLTKATVVWYGAHAKRGVKISHYSQNLNGSRFRIHYNGDVAFVKSKIVGKHQLASIYAAATLGVLAGLTIKQIAKGISQTIPPSKRLNLKVTDHINILDDTYNSSPVAAQESIKTLLELGKGKKKIAVMGEMKDLGDLSTISHKDLGEFVAKNRIYLFVSVGKVAQIVAETAKKAGFKGKIVSVRNTKEALLAIKPFANKKSLFLIKGSRHEHLERIVMGLMHKSTSLKCYHCGRLK